MSHESTTLTYALFRLSPTSSSLTEVSQKLQSSFPQCVCVKPYAPIAPRVRFAWLFQTRPMTHPLHKHRRKTTALSVTNHAGHRWDVFFRFWKVLAFQQ